jgi:DNA mismatch endonuclease (patch repair protein)
MADNLSPEARKLNMSRIRSINTKPEILIRTFLHGNGFRFRLHCKQLPGRPDIVLKKHKLIVLVHGCFWHGHVGCRKYVIPKTRTDYWTLKINRNKERDAQVMQELERKGWRVIIVWECQLQKNMLQDTLDGLLQHLLR